MQKTFSKVMPEEQQETRVPYFQLSVPLIGQSVGYDGQSILWPNDKGKWVVHGRMNCWYAAICMISQYHRLGPRLGNPELWKADIGLTLDDIENIARGEGLRPIRKPSGAVTAKFVLDILKQNGPILALGKFSSILTSHCIVLTGVHDTSILYNDPDQPARRSAPAHWIDAQLTKRGIPLWGKDPARY